MRVKTVNIPADGGKGVGRNGEVKPIQYSLANARISQL